MFFSSKAQPEIKWIVKHAYDDSIPALLVRASNSRDAKTKFMLRMNSSKKSVDREKIVTIPSS